MTVMDNMKKFSKAQVDDMYLTVDQDGVAQNLFATLGMAIDAVAYDKTRLMEDCITEHTPTLLKWKGRDGKDYSLEVMRCPVCKDVTRDYMERPRSVELKIA
jgi:hypothetical protein